jgi:hypothetical protein
MSYEWGACPIHPNERAVADIRGKLVCQQCQRIQDAKSKGRRRKEKQKGIKNFFKRKK